MRILIEHGDYRARNCGDLAMLLAACEQLRTRWPNADLRILTDDPARLAVVCPGAKAVAALQRRGWLGLRRSSRSGIANMMDGARAGVQQGVRAAFPAFSSRAQQVRGALRGAVRSEAYEFLKSVSGVNALVVSGAGMLNDAFAAHAAAVLALVEDGVRSGIPVAMFGQGIGPIESPRLRALASRVLPLVDVIAVREGRLSPVLLHELGVAHERIIVTGDDATGLAYRARPEALGASLGVGIRIAQYSGVDEGHVARLAAVFAEVARQLPVPWLPIPILFHDRADLSVIRRLLPGAASARGAGPAAGDFHGETPDVPAVLANVARCRVVITASYHAAVFALAQGLQVVGLTRSAYYTSKFQGLGDMFDGGCAVVHLDQAQWEHALSEAIITAWHRAPHDWSRLRRSAEAQSRLSGAAYDRFAVAVSRRTGIVRVA